MADVQYKSQPTVTVHGLPQDQYNQQMNAQAGGGGGGIMGSFRQHWPIWTIGIGAATLLIMFMIWRKNQSSVSSATGNDTGTMGTGNSSPDQLWGSQLDADYQQMISNQNTTVGLLQQILNQMSNPSANPPGSPGPPGPPGPPGSTPPPGSGFLQPLFSKGSVPYSKFGDLFTNEGITYELGAGSVTAGQGQNIWGVPITSGHPLSISQWQNTPIGTGQGQKVLIEYR